MTPHGTAAVVTGGASGLGAATARLLASLGARVTIVDRDRDAAQTIASEIGGLSIACDITDGDGLGDAFARASEAHGIARIVVACAGIGRAMRIVGRDGAMPLDEFERSIRVNLIGTFNTMRVAAAAMVHADPLADDERGAIVMTASVAAFDGQLGQAAYAASKGGIVSLTLPAARELAQFGIRVMTIAPGFFRTPLLGELDEAHRRKLVDAIPFPKRLGEPDEFAGLVLECVRNRSLNGETIRLDGALRLPPR